MNNNFLKILKTKAFQVVHKCTVWLWWIFLGIGNVNKGNLQANEKARMNFGRISHFG